MWKQTSGKQRVSPELSPAPAVLLYGMGMSFWDQVVVAIPTIVIGGLAIALGAGIIWGVRQLSRLATGGVPDFVLKRAPNKDWTLERTRRRVVLDVAMGNGTVGTSGSVFDLRMFASNSFGDFEHGRRVQVATDDQTVLFARIDGRKRKYSRSIALTGDMTEAKVFAVKAQNRGISTG